MGVTYDTYIIVDWSGGNQKSLAPCADAIWACRWHEQRLEDPLYFRNRQLFEVWLKATLKDEIQRGNRVFVGFDFAFGFPNGFAEAVTGSDNPLALWDWFERHIVDSPTANNRFDVAGLLNSRFDGIGPFWGNPLSRDIPDLPRKGTLRTCRAFPEKRQVETRAKGAFPVWQLSGVGAVGSQTLTGLPVLWRLRQRFAGQLRVWPFEPLDAPVTFVEVWPSLYARDVDEHMREGSIKDAVQVRVLTERIAQMDPQERADFLDVPASAEGWIFGVTA